MPAGAGQEETPAIIQDADPGVVEGEARIVTQSVQAAQEAVLAAGAVESSPAEQERMLPEIIREAGIRLREDPPSDAVAEPTGEEVLVEAPTENESVELKVEDTALVAASSPPDGENSLAVPEAGVVPPSSQELQDPARDLQPVRRGAEEAEEQVLHILAQTGPRSAAQPHADPPARVITVEPPPADIQQHEPLVVRLPPETPVSKEVLIWSPSPPGRQVPWPDALPRPSPEIGRGAWPFLRKALRFAALGVVLLAGVMVGLIVLYRWLDPPTSTLMLGQRLAGTSITQHWVPLSRISPNLQVAVIMSEDAFFCRHSGIDWGALKEAVEGVADGGARGASTISMQVVKNLFLWPSRSYVRKALELPLAYAIEAAWSKRRILEIYLNIAEWGPGIFGAEAAARHHFGKSVLRLTPHEAALLAVSLPNPFEREAGSPGRGTLRLADNLLARMRSAQTSVACIRSRLADSRAGK
jgi:monofunctional biosynthetic peptidoglycan transglycosylase